MPRTPYVCSLLERSDYVPKNASFPSERRFRVQMESAVLPIAKTEFQFLPKTWQMQEYAATVERQYRGPFEVKFPTHYPVDASCAFVEMHFSEADDKVCIVQPLKRHLTVAISVLQVHKFMVHISHAARLLDVSEDVLATDYLHPSAPKDFRLLVGCAEDITVGPKMPGHTLPCVVDPQAPSGSEVHTLRPQFACPLVLTHVSL